MRTESTTTALERRPVEPVFDEPYNEPAEPHQESPFKKLHQLLSGRYHWALLLGGILAVGLAYLGYTTAAREFQSTALIQFNQPYQAPILFDNPDRTYGRGFDTFVDNQVELMQSRRIIDAAMSSDLWQPHQDSEMTVDERFLEFTSRLNIQRTRGGTNVLVQYTALSPQAAMHAVQAVVSAYEDIYREQNVVADSERLRILELRRGNLSNQLQGLRQQVLDIAREYGTDGLVQIHTAKIQDLNRVEAQLKEVQIALALSMNRQPEENADDPDEPEQLELDLNQMAMSDRQLAQLLQDRLVRQQELEALQQDFGPGHSAIVQAQNTLRTIERAIDERVKTLTAIQADPRNREASLDPSIAWARSVDELRTQEAQLKQLSQDLNREVLEMGRRLFDIQRLRDEMLTVEANLQETRRRLDVLNVESTGSGKMTVVDGALGVSRDTKKTKMAGAGGVGGMALGFAIVAFIGSFDRRIRSSTHAEDIGSGTSLLGILPTLPKDMSSGEAIGITRHSVHHIRTMLQVSNQTRNSRVLTITGPTLASGKTSLTVALGLSYAAGGARTLLIDADLGSGAMTRSVDRIIRRRIGDILAQRGVVSAARIETALHLAKAENRRLGEVLIEMGDVTAEQIHEALAAQESTTVGLMDAVAGKPISESTVETGIENLYILPIGDATITDTPRLSPTSVQNLLQRAGDQFDMVLIDVGPTPGGSQSPLFSAYSDNVVLVVSRGDNRERTRDAVNFLQGIGAHVAGLVYNRASLDDMERSALSSGSQFSETARDHDAHATPGYRRLGVLAQAVGTEDESQGGDGVVRSRRT